MGKCLTDPEKLTNVCVEKNTLNINLTKAGKKRINKTIADIKKDKSVSDQEKQHYTSMFQSVLSSNLEINDSQIQAVTCSPNPTMKQDDLVIVHTPDHILSDRESAPIKPIKLASGTCENFVHKSFLNNKFQPEELFVNTAKNVIGTVQKKMEGDSHEILRPKKG